ncbi:MAG: Stp1/IreP family PP2C-type Ser/Thr phosphatase [Clostridia bacterium]|nr:Stp1/IreP family PP2C-type Ser/Thr phosphatase [Clostridia bacterium]
MQFFGKSDTGKKRSENQDSFITEQLNENTVLCLVCDGMGGANGGSTASALACSTFLKQIKKKLPEFKEQAQLEFEGRVAKVEEVLKKAITATNSAVFKKANKNKDLAGMGTTLVCALVIDDLLYIANVGDSRAYGFTNGEMIQITRDHSYVQTLVDLGQLTPEEAATNPHKNIITKAIGIHKKEDPDIFFDNLSASNADYLLLCSDGLTNFAEKNTIQEIINSDISLEEKCNKLIDIANANGGGDNITVVLIKFKD